MSSAPLTRASFAAIGVASFAGDAVTGAIGGLRRLPLVAATSARVAASVRAASRSPVAAPLVTAIDGFEARGRKVAATTTDRLGGAADAVVSAVGRSDTVLHLVNDVVDRVLWPIVDEVLPAVLDRLAADPEPVQALVVGQSTSIAGDLADVARTGAAHADDRVESMVDRLLRRRPRPAPAPTNGQVGTVPP